MNHLIVSKYAIFVERFIIICNVKLKNNGAIKGQLEIEFLKVLRFIVLFNCH